MSLGDAFPREMVSASSERQLKPGVVVKLEAVLDDGRPKKKRFVVLHVTDDVFVCVMNSEIHPLILGNARRLNCQVEVLSDKYSFADKDCHFDCSKTFTFRKSEVLNQLVSEPAWILGNIDEELRDSIRSAIQASPLISPVERSSFCASLDSLQFG